MDRSEKSQVLLQRAEKLGLRLELDSGLLIVGILELFRRSGAGSSVERDRS